MLAGGALMLLFWTLYFTGAMDLGQHDPVIAAFESAFVLADTALGIFLCAAGWTLLRQDPRGPYLMVIASAMSLYLGLLDLAFYARMGLFESLTGAAAFELSLNTICIVGGIHCLRLGWNIFRSRGEAPSRQTDVLPLYRGPRWWMGGAA
jgi:hypothetical protein